ncbi:MAG: hypothetical protein V9F46_11710 [Chitinophagaceae bacterium]
MDAAKIYPPILPELVVVQALEPLGAHLAALAQGRDRPHLDADRRGRVLPPRGCAGLRGGKAARRVGDVTSSARSSEFAPEINRTDIATYVDVVFGYLEGFVPVRIFPEKGNECSKPRSSYPPCNGELLNEVVAAAIEASSVGRALYVVPGTVGQPGSAKAEEIQQSCVVLVDLDTGDIPAKRDHLIRHLGPASIIVASPGATEDGHEKLHLYWRLTEPAAGSDLVRLCHLRGEIARKAGGDTSFESGHSSGCRRARYTANLAAAIWFGSSNQAKSDYDLDELAERVADLPQFGVVQRRHSH